MTATTKNRKPAAAHFLIRCYYRGNRKPVDTIVEGYSNSAFGISRANCDMVQARQIGYQSGATRVEVHSQGMVQVCRLVKGSYETTTIFN